MINTPVKRLSLLAITGIFLMSTAGCASPFGEREGSAQREEVEENEGVRGRRDVIGREGAEENEEEDDENRDSRRRRDKEDDD